MWDLQEATAQVSTVNADWDESQTVFKRLHLLYSSSHYCLTLDNL